MSTTTLGLDASVLLNYYAARSGVGATSTSATAAAAAKTQPTAPWQASTQKATVSALTRSVLNGARFINPGAAKLDAPASSASSTDYRNLFALYQGLSALSGIAGQASAKSVPSSTLAGLQTRFTAGLGEVSDFLAGSPFQAFSVADAKSAATAQSTVGAAREVDGYTAATLFSGPRDEAVPALAGDVRFSVTATVLHSTTKVDFDLSELGDTPRTISNVTSYLNGKLAAAGLSTRFAVATTAGAAQTATAGGRTLDLGTTSADSQALTIKGTSIEALSFSAPDARPAVYVAQTSGTADSTKISATGTTTAVPGDAVAQLLKFDPSGASPSGTSSVFGRTLPADVANVRATATGPDGALYVLADIKGQTSDGQTIKGTQDVALLRYDSTGTLDYTRTLGAASTATGLGLAVSADGKQVAVAGSVTGDLDRGDAASPTVATSFVQVFASNGDALWTARGAAGEQPRSVAFAQDGSVLVEGATAAQSGLPGAGGVYLHAYSATATTPPGGGPAIYDVHATAAAASAGAGSEKPAGLVTTADGGVVTASVEDGHAILRRYDAPLASGAQPTAVRDLGDLGGGGLAGISLADDGSVIVAGASGSGALSAGATTTGYSGGSQAFVAKVSADLSASGGDRLTYLAGNGRATATGVTVSGGEVYVTGAQAGDPAVAGSDTASHTGYATAVDPQTGHVSWSQSFVGLDGQSSPASIAVDAGGASSLDRLGLPTGTLDYAQSPLVTSATSARTGDRFYVRSGSGQPVAVTLEASDTLSSLAGKINRASGFAATATVVSANGRDQLKITPSSSTRAVSLEAGAAGSDLLGALGLPEGQVKTATTSTVKSKTNSLRTTPYALGLGTKLNLATPADAQKAKTLIDAALVTIKQIFSDLTTPPKAEKSTASGAGASAYTQSRIADYQLALSRLTGSS